MRLSTRRVTATAAAILVSTVGLSACGLGEKAANEAVETAIEKSSEGDGDVDINSEDGSFTVENEDGKMSAGRGDVPDDFPADVPLPGIDFEVLMSSAQGGTMSMMLMMPPVDVAEMEAEFTEALKSAGYAMEETSRINMEDLESVSITGTNAERRVGITIQSTGNDQSSVTYTILPPD